MHANVPLPSFLAKTVRQNAKSHTLVPVRDHTRVVTNWACALPELRRQGRAQAAELRVIARSPHQIGGNPRRQHPWQNGGPRYTVSRRTVVITARSRDSPPSFVR